MSTAEAKLEQGVIADSARKNAPGKKKKPPLKGAQLADKIFENTVMIVATTAVITVLLIFVFIFKEASPVLLERDVWEEGASISKIFFPHSDVEQKEKILFFINPAAFPWDPTSEPPKYSMIPLIVASIKATFVAILFSAPLSIAAAVYTAQFAHRNLREFIKPIVELLAGVPSVVLGFFALLVMAPIIKEVFLFFGFKVQLLNGFTAGIALGIAVIPIIFTLAEDAIRSVPKTYSEASLALGANITQTTWRVILPAVTPGIFAAVVLGFGRAIGETMIVLMASGNASKLSFDIFESLRTISATIAAELGEVEFGEPHYRVLFFLGFVLFVFTFILNYIGDLVVQRFKKRVSGLK